MAQLAYVVNNQSNAVSVIDTSPTSPTFNTEIALIPLKGISPIGIAIVLQNQPQPTPQTPQQNKTECIRVPKIYDWTVSQTQEIFEITIPPMPGQNHGVFS